MERCKTCKHWAPFQGSGSCDVIATNSAWTELEPGQRAVIALEVDSYSAQLQTSPDFGCVLHEPDDMITGSEWKRLRSEAAD